jgi:uncharacterized protein (DUF58 family)
MTQDPRVSPIKLKNFRLLVFGIFLFYLAGSYFGGYLLSLFYFFLLLPLLSLLTCIIAWVGLRFSQLFDNEHPVKGEEIRYRLLLANESFVPAPHIHCRFKVINPQLDLKMPDFSAYLGPHRTTERSYNFRCSYRGIYTVGLQRIEVEDPLGLMTLSPSVEYRTFYVYPRILALNNFPPGLPTTTGTGSGTPHGGDPDYSLYTQVKEYRDGQSIRHLHWKKFISTGRAFVKEFDTTSEPGLRIYFDLRKTPLREVNPLEIEDTSVEILVALVKYYLDRFIPLTVTAPGRDMFSFKGSSHSQFDSFYQSTMRLFFQDTVSPALIYVSDSRSGLVSSSSILFITHILDASLFNLMEENIAQETKFTLIFNQVGYIEIEKNRNKYYMNRLREKGARVLTVNSSDSIVDDLEGEAHATRG